MVNFVCSVSTFFWSGGAGGSLVELELVGDASGFGIGHSVLNSRRFGAATSVRSMVSGELLSPRIATPRSAIEVLAA